MPSSYDPLLRVELQAVGENANTWGTKANTVFTLLAEAIAGYEAVNIAGVGDYTLTASNGIADESRNAIIDLTGALSAAKNVIVPSAGKLYVVRNSTTGGFSVTVKTAAGTGISITPGEVRFLACDGTNVFSVGAPTPVPLAQGGTGQESAVSALTALGGASVTALASVSAEVSILRAESLLKAGGTMTGPLILSSDASVSLQAVTKQQLDAFTSTLPTRFVSTTCSVAFGQVTTLAHGLGDEPDYVTLILVNKTAELAYTPGEKVIVNPMTNPANQAAGYGFSVKITDTNIIVRYSVNGIVLLRADNGGASGISAANWYLQVKAGKF